MKAPWFLALCFFVLPVSGQEDRFAFPSVEAEASLPGVGPLRRYEGLMKRWPELRAKWAIEAEADQKSVVFLGDSITQGWGTSLPGRFPGMKSANRGIGGDTTRGMLIRLDDVLSLNPSAIVLLMGTNDLEVGIEPVVAAENVKLILAAIKARDPKVPVVLCQVFPSSPEKSRPKEKVQELNRLYADLVRGDEQVTLLDTWTLFAGPDGEADPKWFKDLLHLNPEGYARWAAALRPVLATLGFLETERVESPVEEGFVSLFNGKDLTGWGFRPTPPRKPSKNPPKPDAPVFVEVPEAVNFDGKTTSDDGRYAAINGRLVVKTPVEGRRIQQLWTTEEFGSDFILKLEFRATPNADSGVFIRQLQLQCRDFPLAGPYKDLKNYKPQDWNELVVTVQGGKARATCNGEVLEEAMEVPATGPIGLEGDRGQMEYRHLRLKKLN
jgi:lysophospholipase L1-like esterase